MCKIICMGIANEKMTVNKQSNKVNIELLEESKTDASLWTGSAYILKLVV